MIIRLDHIAIAVTDLDVALRRFVEDLGIAHTATEEVTAAKTITAFLPMKGDPKIELIHPLNGEGPVKTHLERRGAGLHHLCFETDDIVGDMQRLKEKGYRFTTESPSPGAHGTQVAFLHPKGFDGVLIELAEHPPKTERAV